MKKVKEVFRGLGVCAVLASSILTGPNVLAASQDGFGQPSYTYGSGFVVVEEGNFLSRAVVNLPAPQIGYNDLRGTWSWGNINTNWFGNGGQVFSSVTGNSTNTAARAQGRATVRDGHGNETSGLWQAPGVNSRAERDRTSGTNSAFWGLRAP